MAFDDPIVWILIVAVVIFLFGANKIPQFARAIGNARKEFSEASKELTNPTSAPQPTAAGATAQAVNPMTTQVVQPAAQTVDPLIEAARKEGIDTQGKTKDQIATELAWKLKNKQ
ncbi:MAG: twin-arginine translocase TatA/TatE family subunit [Nitrososphaerota archaeon]|nr:twin-arginine translocase TatA/TatE family subunit [Nitrososphaerota archaeon]MDG6924329.1 twin-arginine translocase TatA/TatE family subunit [Nitrososphaerota archaeon]